MSAFAPTLSTSWKVGRYRATLTVPPVGNGVLQACIECARLRSSWRLGGAFLSRRNCEQQGVFDRLPAARSEFYRSLVEKAEAA